MYPMLPVQACDFRIKRFASYLPQTSAVQCRAAIQQHPAAQPTIRFAWVTPFMLHGTTLVCACSGQGVAGGYPVFRPSVLPVPAFAASSPFTADYLDYMAEWARRIEGEIITSDRPNEQIFLQRKPVGVVAGILPWNLPFFLIARKMAPALVTGKTIAIKPSEETPINCHAFTELLAQLVTGGTIADLGAGFHYQPTVLSGCTADMDVMTKEVFGPVLPIQIVDDLDEAIALSNSSDYGLTSSVYTRDLSKAMHAMRELEFGETYINRENFEAMQGFHAGVRKSGLGGAGMDDASIVQMAVTSLGTATSFTPSAPSTRLMVSKRGLAPLRRAL